MKSSEIPVEQELEEALKSPRRSLERRFEIARIATPLFARQGYHEIGMRDIAEAVGIRAPSIYKHFSSKQEIIFHIALLMTQKFAEDVLPVLESPKGPVERLELFVEAHIRKLAANQLEHLVSHRELIILTDAQRETVRDIRSYYQRRLRDLISYGVTQGAFTVKNPSLASVAIMDMMNGMSWWLAPDADVDAIVDHYVQYISLGLLKSSRT